MAIKRKGINPKQIKIYNENEVTKGFDNLSITNEKLKGPIGGTIENLEQILNSKYDNVIYNNITNVLSFYANGIKLRDIQLISGGGGGGGLTPEQAQAISDALNTKYDAVALDDKTLQFSSNGVIVGTITLPMSDIDMTEIDEKFNTKYDFAEIVDTNKLQLYSNGLILTTLELPSGGGGGDSGSKMTLRYIDNKSSFTAPFGYETNIGLTFTSLDSIDNLPTGNGVGILSLNNRIVSRGIVILQGDNFLRVDEFLKLGENTLSINVTDAYGTSRTLAYSVSCVEMKITSTFNSAIINTGEINFGYRPYGQFSKTVFFELDGVIIDQLPTIQSDVLLSKTIPIQTHGSHILEVYMEADIDNVIITSNKLKYSFISVVDGDNNVIISSFFDLTEESQYNTISIPYQIYTPNNENSSVALISNGITISALNVNRNLQYWNYRLDDMGINTLIISSGGITETFVINVTQSEITSTAVTENLELFLTSMGRSNLQTNKTEWKYGNISSVLTGFNWTNNGWISDVNNNSVLRVSGNARVTIPVYPFNTNFSLTSKTIEFDFITRDIEEDDVVLISCFDGSVGLQIKPRKTMFKSNVTEVTTDFKEEERIRISFVVKYLPADVGNDIKATSLIFTYINGIISGCQKYTSNVDNFKQGTPLKITLGGNNAVLDIYNIRMYSTYLTDNQILNNYIADIDDITLKTALFRRNQILDQYNQLDYEKLLAKLPIMTLIGGLPQFKGDKKTCDVLYELNTNDVSNSEYQPFIAAKAQIDVQGTSSQYYPRKNYKITFKNGIKINPDTENEVIQAKGKYPLRVRAIQPSLPVSAFCVKADFAESSGVHNTGVAKIVNILLKQLGYFTPPQVTENLKPLASQNDLRTTVDGYPIAIFYKDDVNSRAQFLGKYNFNNDKGPAETFGFTGGTIDGSQAVSVCECWEFKSNAEELCTFQSNDFSSYRGLDTDKPYLGWLDALEARYPDIKPVYANTANLQILWDWVLSTNPLNATNDVLDTPVIYGDTTHIIDSAEYRLDKFKFEILEHFNIDFLIFYYIITELYAMVDQRAKNLFIASWGNEGSGDYKWYCIFYDNDTILGIDNVGKISFGYEVEYHSKVGGADVFAGEQSVLWNNVEKVFQTEITEMYQRVRRENLLSYAITADTFNTQQSDKWAESVYNQDATFKYINPAIYGYGVWVDGVEEKQFEDGYLYEAQGSRVEQRKWWLSNRFNFIDSKYTAGSFNSDFVAFRFYSPTTYVVTPNYDFNVIPMYNQYYGVKYDTTWIREKGFKNQTLNLPYPTAIVSGGQPVVALYGASKLKTLGDLSAKYPHTVFDTSKAVNLVDLIVGNSTPGYSNIRLTSINIGNKPLLKKVDITNLTEFNSVMDFTLCPLMEEILAFGTKIPAVSLSNSGVLRTLKYPNTLIELVLKNQSAITNNGLQIAGYNNMSRLLIENCNSLDCFQLLNTILASPTNVLKFIRMTGINVLRNTGTSADYQILLDLGQSTVIKGIDALGNNTTGLAVLQGDYNISIMDSALKMEIDGYFPGLLKVGLIVYLIIFQEAATELLCAVNFGNLGAGGSYTKCTYQDLYSVTNTIWNNKRSNFKSANIGKFNEFKHFRQLSFLAGTFNITDNTGTFQDNVNLKEITIPANIEYFNGSDFKGCTNLEKITFASVSSTVEGEIPEFTENQLLSFEPTTQSTGNALYNFSKCGGIEELDLSPLVNIAYELGNRTFSDMSNLKKVIFPITKVPIRINDSCFQNTMIETYTYLGNNNTYTNFNGDIKDLSALPNTIIYLKSMVFWGNRCKGLIIHENMTGIEYGAFNASGYYNGLRYLRIDAGNNLTIYAQPFSYNAQLQAIHFTSLTPPLLVPSNSGNASIISYNSNFKAIVVPNGYVDIYKNATNWQLPTSECMSTPMNNAIGTLTPSPADFIISESTWALAKSNGYLPVAHKTTGVVTNIPINNKCEDI